MRAILSALLIGLALPAYADDCSALSDLMVRRKALTETVASWRGHPPSSEIACSVFSELATKTNTTITEIGRLKSQCDTPTFMLYGLSRELYLLMRAENRTCRPAGISTVAEAP